MTNKNTPCPVSQNVNFRLNTMLHGALQKKINKIETTTHGSNNTECKDRYNRLTGLDTVTKS